MSIEPATLALDLRRVSKSYGAVRALDEASLSVRPGEVHGLIGQNGAGKSTLMKILSGLEKADAGSIAIDGTTVDALSPGEMLKRGIGIVYQDRMTVPTFTVEEALFFATDRASSNGLTLNRGRLRREADAVIERYFGVHLPRRALMRDLTTAQQQIVHITRTLLREPRILVFDEPTAALARQEVESLFGAIDAMRRDGLTVVYISHYLGEIEEICDRITVLRNGRDVATLETRDTSVDAMTELMIGGDPGAIFPDTRPSGTDVILAVRDLSLKEAFRSVSLDVHRGEIVGVTGLIGSGIKEFTQALFGLAHAGEGTMTLAGSPFAPRSPRDALRAGVALVPEDRRSRGIGLALSLKDNIVLASLPAFSRFGFLRRGREAARARGFIESLRIKAPDETVLASSLSGGNQQKVAIAKWLCRAASLYVLDEPTVGVDVATKAEIYRLLRQLADAGHGLVVVSSDLDEVQGLCDRVVVFHRGRVVLDEPSGRTSSARLLTAAVGQPDESLPA